mgnify:CR=1 FL=1
MSQDFTPSPHDARIEWRQLALFFLVACAILAAGIGLRDPWPSDEPRFVLVAKQMVESGDWLFPHRGQELYAEKPPLYFWMLAGAYALTGSWRWSFLLPSLLAGLGVLWLTYDLARRLWNHRAGLYAAMAVLAAVQFVYQFKRAQIDPSLTFCTTLAFYGLCRHLLLGPHWDWFWAACLVAGAGVVMKGVGFLPLLLLLPYALLRRGRWQGLAEFGRSELARWSLGVLAFLAPIAAWLGPMLAAATRGGDPAHQAYLHDLLFRQTAERFANPWHHHEPFWYFGEIVLLFWAPFSLAFFWLWRDWREAWRARAARTWLPLAWALMVLLLFSLSAGKRDMYILPALPAFAVAAAPFLPALTERHGFRLALWVFTLALGLLLLGLGASAWHDGHANFIGKLLEGRGADEVTRALGMLLVALGAAGTLAALILRPRRAVAATAVLLTILWLGYGFGVHPLLDPSSSSRVLMQAARAAAGPEITLGLVDWKEQNLLQAVGPVTEFGFRARRGEQLRRAERWLREAPAERRLFVQDADEGERDCLRLDAGHAERVGIANRRTWWLAGVEAIDGSCQ